MRPPACRATCSGTGQCLAGDSMIVESFTGVARPRNGGRRHRRALSRLCSRDDGTQVSRRQQMVKMRHIAEIPDLGFAGLPPGLEVITPADLRGRPADCMSADLMRPQRLTLSPCSGAGCGTTRQGLPGPVIRRAPRRRDHRGAHRDQHPAPSSPRSATTPATPPAATSACTPGRSGSAQGLRLAPGPAGEPLHRQRWPAILSLSGPTAKEVRDAPAAHPALTPQRRGRTHPRQASRELRDHRREAAEPPGHWLGFVRGVCGVPAAGQDDHLRAGRSRTCRRRHGCPLRLSQV